MGLPATSCEGVPAGQHLARRAAQDTGRPWVSAGAGHGRPSRRVPRDAIPIAQRLDNGFVQPVLCAPPRRSASRLCMERLAAASPRTKRSAFCDAGRRNTPHWRGLRQTSSITYRAFPIRRKRGRRFSGGRKCVRRSPCGSEVSSTLRPDGGRGYEWLKCDSYEVLEPAADAQPMAVAASTSQSTSQSVWLGSIDRGKLLIPLNRRDVREAEGARLESVCRGNSTVGSNPTLSANFIQQVLVNKVLTV